MQSGNISETGDRAITNPVLLFLVEFRDVILKLVNPGADRERNTDGADDCLTLVESLDLDLHLREVLFGTAHDDIPVATVTEAHDDKRVDLGEHFLVDVLGLLGHYAEPDPELPPLHGAFPEDLGGEATTREYS